MSRRSTTGDLTIRERIRTRREVRGWSIRFAASRAGINPSTWSRIERGITSADNRFVLAEIAAALECSVAELTGMPSGSADPDVAAALAGVAAVREALIDADLGEEPTCTPRSLVELTNVWQLESDLRTRCDYAGALRLLPGLIRELHARSHGPDRPEVLRLLTRATYDAFICVASVGYVGEGWLAARLCRQAAEALDDPVALGFSGFTLSRAAVSCGSYRRALTLADRHATELDGHMSTAGATEMMGMLRLGAAHAARALRADADAYLAGAAELADRSGETATHGLYFGPTNVRIWRVAIDVDGGDPGRAVSVARETKPQVIPAACRQSLFYMDTARALARLGRGKDATKMLLVGERIAPQRIRASKLIAETVRGLVDKASSPELRGIAERMGVA